MDMGTFLDQGGMAIMAALAVWLVKVVVNDIKHAMERIERLIEKVVVLLERD